MAPIGGFLESVFELRYEISVSKGKGQKEKSSLFNGADQYWIAPPLTQGVTPRQGFVVPAPVIWTPGPRRLA